MQRYEFDGCCQAIQFMRRDEEPSHNPIHVPARVRSLDILASWTDPMCHIAS